MTGTIVLLLLTFSLTLMWLDGARARELGAAVAAEMCRERGFQLLDETICLTRMSLIWTAYGIRFKRVFRFDYSVEGIGRQHGFLLMHGSQVIDIDLADLESQTDESPEPVSADANEKGDDNVIPFRKRH